MPLFLNTRGNNTLSIAICDRCRMKRPYDDLSPDTNFPGLRVCSQGCKDNKDPYRLPARQTERIAIRFPRPDVNIGQVHDALTTEQIMNPVSPEAPTPSAPVDGNLDNLSP